jgi:hypothetical protein
MLRAAVPTGRHPDAGSGFQGKLENEETKPTRISESQAALEVATLTRAKAKPTKPPRPQRAPGTKGGPAGTVGTTGSRAPVGATSWRPSPCIQPRRNCCRWGTEINLVRKAMGGGNSPESKIKIALRPVIPPALVTSGHASSIGDRTCRAFARLVWSRARTYDEQEQIACSIGRLRVVSHRGLADAL